MKAWRLPCIVHPKLWILMQSIWSITKLMFGWLDVCCIPWVILFILLWTRMLLELLQERIGSQSIPVKPNTKCLRKSRIWSGKFSLPIQSLGLMLKSSFNCLRIGTILHKFHWIRKPLRGKNKNSSRNNNCNN